ncbi:hypothetical protein EV194_104218 [Natronoflexus pectinivorans]|uniref:Uncharacterized protein n=1 Tax=Natronoflexus pectinivorans TaxID=682526 RepID=A0A4R2GK04_9BACT|nr:hypothetical protein EV194_104218 [Natronoflexus pectinivorans]
MLGLEVAQSQQGMLALQKIMYKGNKIYPKILIA